MKFISLDSLRNSYPLDNNPSDGTPNPNYISQLGENKLQGKFNSNIESISQKTDLSKLKVLSGDHSFRFVLKIDDELITSNPFLQDLKRANNTNNPYFIIDNVPIVSFSLSELTTPRQEYTFGEAYAETEVVNNVNKGGDVLKNIVDHIDWLVQKDDQKLRSYSELGSWELSTTNYDPTTDTGMKVELTEDVEQEKLKSSEETI